MMDALKQLIVYGERKKMSEKVKRENSSLG